ncbi:MAG: 5-bromo-4-chloroindolyl phosphate hydrolysis family protein [Lachnospiraceae bacterium]|nr:5-bromo-4-chloroindolyl phosphate hydrolysis family protein [Lachnospiraceae bacterium]
MGNSSDFYSNLTDAGSEIMNSINKAVSSGDFSHLNQDISNAASQIQQSDKAASQQFTGSTGQSYANNQSGNSRDRKVRSLYDIPEMTASFMRGGAGKTPYFQKSVQKSEGVLSVILGTFGLIFWGVPAIALIGTSAGAVAAFAILAGIHGWLLYRGLKIRRLVRKYYQYGDIVGGRPYFDIRTLADGTAQTEKSVLESLNRMIQKSYFRWAHISRDNRTLFLTEDSYNQYLQVLSGRSQMEDEKAAESGQAQQDGSGYSKEVQQILEQGREYIRSVQEANNAIPEKGMSEKLDRLQNIMERIFDAVKKDPSSASGLRRFMNYYLPTTDKLLKAYVDLENQPAGPNVEKTKKDIEDSMDTIISAYEKLLDSMFEDLSWDVASDISVMKTMMKQDGLAGDDIRSQSRK